MGPLGLLPVAVLGDLFSGPLAPSIPPVTRSFHQLLPSKSLWPTPGVMALGPGSGLGLQQRGPCEVSGGLPGEPWGPALC